MTAGCNPRPDTGAVVVSVVGGAPAVVEPATHPIDDADRVLMDAVAQGLIRFDAAGQIEAGLAERWTVVDDGMTYIFRLRNARWSDGSPVTADQVAVALRRQVAAGSRNALAPFLTAIEAVVAMTPQVIEVRLSRPRPDLLKLFAQADLGILRLKPAAGSGPFRLIDTRHGVQFLRPVAETGGGNPDDDRRRRPEDDVHLIAERAARAIVRFTTHRSDLMEGGTYLDWPLLATNGDVAPANIRIDPAAGLFGLAIASRDGFLAETANRAAVAEAIDAAAVTASVSPTWQPITALLPDNSDSIAAPATPPWVAATMSDRIAAARARVQAWRGGAVTLRIALPRGPGATRVFGAIAAGLARIGIGTARVAMDAPAELRLVDAVAPYDSARWYLATACQPCSDTARAALDAARDAPTLAERGARIAEADRALAEDVAFISLARPLRWSLVALRLRQWQPNARVHHPLNRLRADAM